MCTRAYRDRKSIVTHPAMGVLLCCILHSFVFYINRSINKIRESSLNIC